MATFVPNKTIPPAPYDQRKTITMFSSTLVKGQLNKIRSRLPVLAQSQESSRTVMAEVSTDKLYLGPVTGTFQVAEVITGGTSLATGTTVAVLGGSITYTPTAGTFVVGETITGGTSAATAAVTSIDTPTLVGQIIKLGAEDNVDGIMLTVKSRPAGVVVDGFEASQANLQLAWVTAGVAALRNTSLKTEGTASIKLDQSANTNIYTYTWSSISHGAVTGGPFELNETVTGGTSGATGVVEYHGVDELRLVNVVGVFQNAETLTGGTSLATATSTSTLSTSTDWSTAEDLAFDFYLSSKKEQQLQLSISDGVNTAVQVFSGQPGAWISTSTDIATLAATGAPGPVDLTAVTKVILQPITKAKAGYFIGVDNMRVNDNPGRLGLRFYDMGSTLPVSGVATLGGGTAKNLGDLSIGPTPAALITHELNGGKELIDVSAFGHGQAKELGSNTPLTPGNYYAVVCEYVDVDVDIYGSDPTLGTDYYANGYAFTTPDTASVLTSLGANYDCMFALRADCGSWVSKATIIADADPGGGEFLLVAEDTGMQMRVLGRGRAHTLSGDFDFSESPVYLPSGGKFELYYTDVFSSSVTEVTLAVESWSEKFDAYVVDP